MSSLHQRSASNLAGSGKDFNMKKSMNDVFAKYASVAQINLGKPSMLP